MFGLKRTLSSTETRGAVFKHFKYLFSTDKTTTIGDQQLDELIKKSDQSTVHQLIQDSTVTTDETPAGKVRKPRHPPRPPSSKPVTDLSGKSYILFPGQGLQFVGMGQKLLDVPAVKEMYSDASQILGYDLLKLCLEGPKSVLDETQYCQAATVVTSLAAVELLYNDKESAVENCLAVAGFSVGEITALIFSGAISFSEGIQLVKIRGEAMQAASQLTRSGMMSVFVGADSKLSFGLQVAEEWCRREHQIENPVCRVANHLYCGAKVVAGNVEALDFLVQNKKDFNIKRTKRLPVSGAFHTPLMEPAVEPFREALIRTRISNPRIPVYSNVNNKVLTRAEEIKRTLPKQLVSPVKWESSMSAMFKLGTDDIYPSVYECGPGSSLSAILNKVNGKAGKNCHHISV